MIQSVQWWLGSAVRPTSIAYRHLSPAYLGDVLECGGTVTDVDDDGFSADLWVRTHSDVVTTSGRATFSWGDG